MLCLLCRNVCSGSFAPFCLVISFSFVFLLVSSVSCLDILKTTFYQMYVCRNLSCKLQDFFFFFMDFFFFLSAWAQTLEGDAVTRVSVFLIPCDEEKQNHGQINPSPMSFPLCFCFVLAHCKHRSLLT